MNIQRISEGQFRLSLFSLSENFDAHYARFLKSNLGKIHSAIPWDALVKTFGITESSKGRNLLFSPKGRLGLMFLKNYTGLSDAKLIEQLNSNFDYQFFCDIELGFERLTNFKIVSQIRCELSENLDIDSLEKALFASWKPYMDTTHQIVMDATCYESAIRYPTDQKLLWESINWLHKQLKKTCKIVDTKMLRTKYLKYAKRYQGFSKMRKKTHKKRRSLTRSLLYLLHKLLGFEKKLNSYSNISFTPQYYKRIATIQKIYEQQQFHFDTGEKIKDRIVSIDKDYLRPIVRGKEIKSVEFGAKVNKIMIDGISFIEHLDFNAFHEGIRLRYGVEKAQILTRKKVHVLGADKIYATNKNRAYCTSKGIKTDFIPKGKKSKDDKEKQVLRKAISKERSTRLEGSFGKDKAHYHLRKINARTKKNEILWIFFGIHTGNALEIGRRKAVDTAQKVA